VDIGPESEPVYVELPEEAPAVPERELEPAPIEEPEREKVLA
jgi:hypothetical protein